MSPQCRTFAFSKWTEMSVSVWAGAKRDSATLTPLKLREWLSGNVCCGSAAGGEAGTSNSRNARWCASAMRFFVFSCATTVAPAACRGALLSTWSRCQWVLTTRCAGPFPRPASASFNFGHAGWTNVSTTSRPSGPCSTTTLPPGPESSVRFSASGCDCMGAAPSCARKAARRSVCAAGCWTKPGGIIRVQIAPPTTAAPVSSISRRVTGLSVPLLSMSSCPFRSKVDPPDLFPRTGPLILVRIELLLSRHHHDERRERVQHGHRVALRRQHVRQPPVRVRRLVQPAAAQDYALAAHPLVEHVPRHLALRDDRARLAVHLAARRRPRHHAPGAVHRRVQRGPLALRVAACALDDPGVVAHRAAHEPLLPRKRGRRALADHDVLRPVMRLLPGKVVMVVHQLDLVAAQDLHDLACHPLPPRVGVLARQGHQVPIVVPQRLREREQRLGLRHALTPLLALRERQEPRGHRVPEPAAAEVHAHPDVAALVGEHVHIVVAASDRAELVPRLGAQPLALVLARQRVPRRMLEQRMIRGRVVGAVVSAHAE